VDVGWRTKLATYLGVDRSDLYRLGLKEDKDRALKGQIEAVLATHQLYGHRRVAIELGIGKNRAGRVMRKYGLGPKPRTKPRFRSPQAGARPAPRNLVLELGLAAAYPGHLWACDFTYIWCMGRWYFLATVIDLFTRELVGWSLSRHHDTSLVLGALYDALARFEAPYYLHFDRGSEYLSDAHLDLCDSLEITVSASHKASPWENGYQERWNGTFKAELRLLGTAQTEGELFERVAATIHYYNHDRIHTKLKTSPVKFRLAYESLQAKQSGGVVHSDKMLQKSGT
jgi:transposase InsO family protein